MPASCCACRRDLRLELLERDRLVDQLDLGGLAAGQRLAGDVLLGVGREYSVPICPSAEAMTRSYGVRSGLRD